MRATWGMWSAIALAVLIGTIAIVIAAGMGQSNTQRVPGGVLYSHDPAHHVSCWQGTYSISCLPDSEVTLP